MSFQYEGCDGNANNFGSVEACHETCGAPGPAPLPENACEVGSVALGQFAVWCGQANVVAGAGEPWAPNPSCVDGCEQNTIDYCRNFWPETTAIQHIAEPLDDVKPFKGGRACDGDTHWGRGQAQYVCCQAIR